MAAVMAWTVALAAQTPQTTQPRTSTQPTTPLARDTTASVSYIGCVESAGPNAFALTVSELPDTTAPAARPTGTTGPATVGQRVQLIGSARNNISTHVGHKVEVTGTMVPQGAAQGRTTGQPAAEMRLNVTNVRMISAMCDPVATSTPQPRPRSQAPERQPQRQP
jgi:hypothetical protein